MLPELFDSLTCPIESVETRLPEALIGKSKIVANPSHDTRYELWHARNRSIKGVGKLILART